MRIALLIGLCCVISPPHVTLAAPSSVYGTAYRSQGETLRAAPGVFVSILASSGRLLATTRTDRQGRYLFSQMSPGRYFVTASRPGFFVSRAGGRADARSSIACSNTCDPAEVDFELMRGAVLGGVVADALGEGIQGAKVTVYREKKGLSGITMFDRSTDDRGRFRMAGLQPGTYTVTVRGGAFSVGTKAFRTVLDVSAGEVLDVSAGEVLDGLRFTLGGEEAVVFSGAVSGVLAGEAYNSIIRLQPLMTRSQLFETRIDNDGRFEFASLSEGRYAATAVVTHKESFDQTRYFLGAVDVGSSSQDVALSPVEHAVVVGRVEFVAGSPPERMSVQMTSSEGFGRHWSRVQGAEGEFELEEMIPGAYSVEARAGQFYIRSVDGGGRGRHSTEVILSPGRNTLTIVAAADHSRVSGTVRHPDSGDSLPSARVALDGERGTHLVRADEKGRFEVGMVAPGEYRICAWTDIAPEAVEDEASWEKAGCESRFIPIDPESEIEIDVRAAR